MALVLADRVKETSSTTGTGSFTLGGASTGFQSFDSAIGNANTTYYVIENTSAGEWETGLGTFTSPSTLARTTVTSSSNSGSPVNFSSGSKTVFVDMSATKGPAGVLGVANGGTGVATSTGSGSVVLSTSPTLVTPALGIPSSATLTNATGLPISTGVSGLGSGVATFLVTPSSSNLASAVTDETGSGALVFATSPALVTPALGTPSSVVLTNATGLPLSTGITGTLAIANGGTAQSTYATGDTLYASALNTVSKLPIGSTGQVLTVVSGVPTWATSTGGVSSFSGGTTGLTPSGVTTGAIALAGTLAVANGGTGVTTSTGTGSTVLSDAPTLTGTALATNLTASGVVTASVATVENGIFVNNQTVAANYTIAVGYNAMSAGPVTVNSGITVTVSSNSSWAVV